MQKWKRKDLPAIRRSMANPGQKCVLSKTKRSNTKFFLLLVWQSVLLPYRRVGQTDNRPPGELQTEGFGSRYDQADWLSNWPPADRPDPDAASAYCHAVPAVFTHAPAPPASSSAPGSGSTGSNVPRPGPDASPPHSPWSFPQSAHPAAQQASRRFLHRAWWHTYRGGRTGPQHHGLCPSR